MSLDMLETMRHYIFGEASIFFLLCGKNGRILETNKFSKDLLGTDPVFMRLNDIIVDFHDLIELHKLVREGNKEHLVNIKTFTGLPQSIYIKIYDLETNYLILGRRDIVEQETLRKQTIELNNELNSISRQLHKTNAELMKIQKNRDIFTEETIASLRDNTEKLLININNIETSLREKELSEEDTEGIESMKTYCKTIIELINKPQKKLKEIEHS